MPLNYAGVPDSPIPQRNPRASSNEPVHWEDLESYIGSSDEEVGRDHRPQSLDLQWGYVPGETEADMYGYDAEDVQWWHILFNEQQHWTDIQVVIFALSMGMVCLVSLVIILILVN